MTDAAPPVDPDEFRRTIARWASGVAIVTGRSGSFDVGLTVNSLISIALRPPTVLVSLSESADSTPIIEREGVFGVSILTVAQRSISERFAQAIPSEEKFAGLPVHRGTTGVALLDGSLATLECRVERTVPVADHHLVVGLVVAVGSGPDAVPLTFFRSRYGEAGAPGTLRFPVGP
jgi:flavin reductase